MCPLPARGRTSSCLLKVSSLLGSRKHSAIPAGDRPTYRWTERSVKTQKGCWKQTALPCLPSMEYLQPMPEELFSSSVVSDCFATPWTIVHQAPLSVGFPRHWSWSGLPFPSPGDLPDPGIKPTSPASPALQAGSSSLSHQVSPAWREPRSNWKTRTAKGRVEFDIEWGLQVFWIPGEENRLSHGPSCHVAWALTVL